MTYYLETLIDMIGADLAFAIMFYLVVGTFTLILAGVCAEFWSIFMFRRDEAKRLARLESIKRAKETDTTGPHYESTITNLMDEDNYELAEFAPGFFDQVPFEPTPEQQETIDMHERTHAAVRRIIDLEKEPKTATVPTHIDNRIVERQLLSDEPTDTTGYTHPDSAWNQRDSDDPIARDQLYNWLLNTKATIPCAFATRDGMGFDSFFLPFENTDLWHSTAHLYAHWLVNVDHGDFDIEIDHVRSLTSLTNMRAAITSYYNGTAH